MYGERGMELILPLQSEGTNPSNTLSLDSWPPEL